MVGDGDSTEDITIALVFLFSREGAVLTAALEEHHNVDVLLLPKERELGHGEYEQEADEAADNSSVYCCYCQHISLQDWNQPTAFHYFSEMLILSRMLFFSLLSFLTLHFVGSPPHFPDKTEKTPGMNIKLRLAKEGELEEGSGSGPTLEFVLNEDGVLLKEEDLGEQRHSQEPQQFCAQATESDRTEPCSADPSQTPSSEPVANP